MKTSARTILRLATLIAAIAIPTTGHAAPPVEPSARSVAKAYAIDGFARVESIAYTFNVKLPGKKIARSWVWRPKTGEVSYSGPGPDGASLEFTYRRLDPPTPETADLREAVDQWFINDKYWLLFPFHLVWDRAATVSYDGIHPLPIAGNRKRQTPRLTVSYPKEGGYTPGDAYRLYLNDDGTIAEWEFLKGADESAARPATWSPPTSHGPIKISTDHTNGDGTFKLWFTGVEVTEG